MRERERERENTLMPVTVWLGFCYSMAKPPHWAIGILTALNIKELTLFDMF